MNNKISKGSKNGSNPIQSLVEEISGLIVLAINNIAKLSAKGILLFSDRMSKRLSESDSSVVRASKKLKELKK